MFNVLYLTFLMYFKSMYWMWCCHWRFSM